MTEIRLVGGGGGGNSSNSMGGCGSGSGSAATASEAAKAGMELHPVAARRFQSLMKSSNCNPTGALLITMADREALCFACPAAPCSTHFESAVYSSLEALKQHRVRRHSKISDVTSYMTLETLNGIIHRGDIQRVTGIQTVAGGMWARPCAPPPPREAPNVPPPPEFRVISLFEDRSGILSKYTQEVVEAHRQLFEVRVDRKSVV